MTLYSAYASAATIPEAPAHKGYSRYESVRQLVLKAMRAHPRDGRDEYGFLFYDDFADNPIRYFVSKGTLHQLQQRAFMMTALHQWQHLERKHATPMDALKAAHLAYSMRYDPTIPAPFHFKDKDLKKLGIAPAAFDQLVDVLMLNAIDAEQKRQDTEDTQPDADWMPWAKNFLGLPTDERVYYKIALIVRGYDPVDSHPLFFRPIKELVHNILYTPAPEFTRDPVHKISDLSQPLQQTFPALYTQIEKALLHQGAEKTRGHIEQPLQLDQSPLIHPQSMPDIDALRGMHTLTRDAVEGVFNERPATAATTLRNLIDLFTVAQVDAGRFGLKKDDVAKLRSLSVFSVSLDTWRHLDAHEPARFALISDWLRMPPFATSVMVEMDIIPSMADIFIKANALTLLQHAAEQISDGKSVAAEAHQLLNAYLTPVVSDEELFAKLKGSDFTARHEQDILNRNYHGLFVSLGLDPKNPMPAIARHFDSLPDDRAPVKAWFPALYERVCARNGLKPLYDQPASTPPKPGLS